MKKPNKDTRMVTNGVNGVYCCTNVSAHALVASVGDISISFSGVGELVLKSAGGAVRTIALLVCWLTISVGNPSIKTKQHGGSRDQKQT